MALLALLMGAVSCGTSGGDKPPKPAHPVFDAEQSMQLLKARDVTRQSGLSHFTSTVVVGSAGGDAVETAKGEQDWGRGTAYAERTMRIPDDFPEGVADRLGPPGTETFAIVDRQVLVRDGTAWLHYPPTGGDPVEDETRSLQQVAGETAPYGGTLAEVIASARPQGRPVVRDDGGRDYRAVVPGGVASNALPEGLGRMKGDWNSEKDKGQNGMFPMEIRLDAQGRVTRAAMDLTPLLAHMRDGDGVKSIRATYEMSDHGNAIPRPLPDRAEAQDATRTVTALRELAPGDCALTAPGLPSVSVVREVPCDRRHDLRVITQSAEAQDPEAADRDAAMKRAAESCRKEVRTAPEEWQRDAVPAGRSHVMSGSHFVGTATDDGKRHGRFMDYLTCYVRTSPPSS